MTGRTEDWRADGMPNRGDHMPCESAARQDRAIDAGSLRAALRGEFERAGYVRYKMRKFEPYALYAENLPFLKDEHVLTFSDPGGALMALKPDITLSIAKNAHCGEKLYYTESVYRVSREMRSFREIPQMGLECVGRVDDCATAEVTHLAIASLRATGANYALDIGHMGFLSALMDKADCLPSQREQISRLLGGKNAHELSLFCESCGFSDEMKDAFLRLATLRGAPKDALDAVKVLVKSDAMRAAYDELVSLSKALDALDEAQNVSLDFSIVNDLTYYNGIVLRGYIEGVPRAVLSGGRYDPLLQRLGRRGEAMGFALYLDELSRAFENTARYDVDVLCLYDEESDPAALTCAADACRKTGQSVRTALDIPEGLRYRRLMRFADGRIEEVKPC